MVAPQRSSNRRFRPLPGGTSVHDVADRCRTAVIDFLRGVSCGWSAIDLELWLGAPYGSASCSLGRVGGLSRTTFTLSRGGSRAVIEASLLEAEGIVRELLASCSEGDETPRFVSECIERGFVSGVTDRNGAIGYVPVDAGEMCLVDRLASLIAADFLTRRADYRTLTLCGECGTISFESACNHGDEQHVPYESGVVSRVPSASARATIVPPKCM